jgi:hypothetical protein
VASRRAVAAHATTPLRRPARIDHRACLAGIIYQLRSGIPLAFGLSAANTHDSLLLEPMVDAVPGVKGPRGRPGRPRRRPAKLHGDKGYDYPRCRRALRRRGITPRIARGGVESSGKLVCAQAS